MTSCFAEFEFGTWNLNFESSQYHVFFLLTVKIIKAIVLVDLLRAMYDDIITGGTTQQVSNLLE
jgi:hypothetical protein